MPRPSVRKTTPSRDRADRGDRIEIALGGIAERHGETVAVKDFGKRMVQDDRVSAARLEAIAQRDGISLSKRPSATGASTLHRLKAESGPEFDRDYVHAAVELSKGAVTRFETEARNGWNSDLRQFAQATLPVLRQHLQMADALETDIARHALHLSTSTGPAAALPGSRTGSPPGSGSRR